MTDTATPKETDAPVHQNGVDLIGGIKSVAGVLLAALIAIFGFFNIKGAEITNILRNNVWEPTAAMALVALAVGASIMSAVAKNDKTYAGNSFLGVLVLAGSLPALIAVQVSSHYPFRPTNWWVPAIIVGVLVVTGLLLVLEDLVRRDTERQNRDKPGAKPLAPPKFQIDRSAFWLFLAIILLAWGAYIGVRIETRTQSLVIAPQLAMSYSTSGGDTLMKVEVVGNNMADDEYIRLDAVGFAADDDPAASRATGCEGDAHCEVLADAELPAGVNGMVDRSVHFSVRNHPYVRIFTFACFNRSPSPVPARDQAQADQNCIRFTPSDIAVAVTAPTTVKPEKS